MSSKQQKKPLTVSDNTNHIGGLAIIKHFKSIEETSAKGGENGYKCNDYSCKRLRD